MTDLIEIRGSEATTRRLIEIGADMPTATRRAVNRVGEMTRTAAVRNIAADLGGLIERKAVDRSVVLDRANYRNPMARVLVGGYRRAGKQRTDGSRDTGDFAHARGRIPLFLFKAHGLPKGVSYQLPGSAYFAPERFIARMRSGHVGAFGRADELARESPKAWGPNLPIFELFGPSPQRIFKRKLIDKALADGRALLDARLNHEINFILQQRGSNDDGSTGSEVA